MTRHMKFAAAGFIAACSIANTVDAHVTAQPAEAAAGTYVEVRLRVPHGCEGAPTVALRVKMPDDVISAKAQMKPGWTVQVKTRRLAQQRDSGHGKSTSETVDEIEWRGGPLPDALYDDFGIVMAMPATPGRTLYLPVVQECAKGLTRWIDLPSDGKPAERLEHPAPSVRLRSQ